MAQSIIGQIHPNAFCHPADRQATDKLRKVPLLPDVLRTVSRLKVEQEVRAHFMFHSIELGSRQLPSLWRMVHEVAEMLCIPPPDVFVSGEGGPNAFAFGVERHTVVLTNSLVDMMTDKELQAIITHEMAHILCQHMLFRQVGLALVGSTAGQLAKLLPSRLVSGSLIRLIFAWYRAAEYSADRAALIVLDDPEPLVSCLARLSGLPRRFASEFDLRSFAMQVEVFEARSNLWSRFLTLNMSSLSSHPEPARRAVDILEWARSEEYRRIRDGQFLTRMEGEADEQVQIDGVKSCSLCGRPVGEREVCPGCDLPQDPALQLRCPRGHLSAAYWKFCKSCGTAITEVSRRNENPDR